MEVVKSSLMNEEARRGGRNIAPLLTGAYVAEKQGRGRTMSRKNEDEDSESRGRSKSRGQILCFYCDNHRKSECRKWKRDKAKQKERRRDGPLGTVSLELNNVVRRLSIVRVSSVT